MSELDLARTHVEQLRRKIDTLLHGEPGASPAREPWRHDLAEALELLRVVEGELQQRQAALAAERDHALRIGEERAARLRAEAARAAVETLLDRVSDAFVALDTAWRFRFVNRAASRVLSRRSDELLGQVAWEVLPELQGSGLQQQLYDAMQQQRPQHVDDYLPALGRWCSVHAYPSPDGVSVFLEDISDRKAAEGDREQLIGELEAERALLDEVIQQMPDGVLVVEAPSGRVLTHNEAARGMWEESPPLPLAPDQYAQYFRCFHLDGRPYPEEELPGMRTIRTGQPVPGEEMMLVAGDRPPRIVSVKAGPVRNLSGQVVAAVVTVREVTAERRREEEERFLNEVSEILSSSLDYRATVQGLARLCARSLADYCVVHVAERDRIRGLGIAHRDPEREDDLREVLRGLPLEPHNPVVQVLHGDAPLVLSDVDEVLLERIAATEAQRALLRSYGLTSLVVVPLRARGRTLGTISLARGAPADGYDQADLPLVQELARRAALAVDNARLYREARHAVETREQLLGVVSHDLRNTLNAGLMNADLLLEITPAFTPGTPQRRQMEALRRSLDHMHRLVQDLLDMDSIEQGRLSLHVVGMEAAVLGQELAEAFEPLAREREVTLRVEFDPGLPAIRGDRDRVVQIFSNLISNALGFTPAGGLVQVRAERSGERVVFRVSDTGPGIPPEELPRLFDRYWKSQLRRSQGAGLGLSIVRGLVHAQGGEIWVESQVGQGATFFVALPAAA